MALTEGSPVSRTITAIGPKFKITLKAGIVAVKTGDALAYSAGWTRALATVGTATQTRLIALQPGEGGDVIEVAQIALIAGFTGGTPGNPLYQAEGTAYGQYTETAPSTTGDVNTIIGRIISATEVLATPDSKPDSLAA